MLIVSSLAGAEDAYRKYRPSRVISLLSEEEAAPTFDGLAARAHLSLHVDRESCARTIDRAARGRAEEVIAFMRDWDGAGDVLIHCNRGVSRSMAAAFIIMCMQAPDADEAMLLNRLRKIAPHADPCPLLVSYGDDLLAREGRMIDALCELGPPSPAISAPLSAIDLAG